MSLEIQRADEMALSGIDSQPRKDMKIGTEKGKCHIIIRSLFCCLGLVPISKNPILGLVPEAKNVYMGLVPERKMTLWD